MSIPTRLIPQADRIDVVIEVVEAIGEGHNDFDSIANYIGYVDRQGRYYRMASEILGLTIRTSQNYSELTERGQRFLDASAKERMIIIQEALIGNPLFRLIIDEFKNRGQQGLTEPDIREIIKEESETTPGMLNRRTHSVIRWLQQAHVVREISSRYYLVDKLPGPTVVDEITDSTKQILSPDKKLKPFEGVDMGDDEEIVNKMVGYVVDEGKREKANLIHKRLVYLMAEKISEAGGKPRVSDTIDLATCVSGENYIFEMKSISTDNVHDQIRKAISQLYEYSYLHDLPDANLCIVVNKKLPTNKEWLIDYLIENRGILICWKKNGNFDAPDVCRQKLNKFLD